MRRLRLIGLISIGELGTALKQRLPDSNKVVQGLALDAVVHLATGVGKPFDRSAKLFIGPICGILADAKATVRAPALAALTAIYDQCGLDCMIPHVANGLEPANPLQRNELASWLSSRLANTESEHDLLPLVGPVIACLEDKSVDVRKAAQSLLPAIISSVGFPRVMDRASALKPASRSVVIPMLETAKLAVAARSLARDSQDTPTDEAAPALLALTRKTLPIGSSSAASKGLPAVTRSLKTPAISTLNDNTRAPTPLSRPASSTNTTNVSTSLNKKGLENVRPAIRSPENPSKHTRSLTGKAGPASLFRTSDSTGKQTRAARETGALKWLVEDNARADQIEYLQQQMTSHISPDLLALMFSRDHNSDRDHAEALALLTGLAQTVNYDEIESYTPEQQENRSQLLANSDLVLKYVTIRLCDHSSSMVLACLDLVEALFQVMLSARYHMADYEASSFLPSIVAKVSSLSTGFLNP